MFTEQSVGSVEAVDQPGVEKLMKVPPHHAPLVAAVQVQLPPGQDVADHQLQHVVQEPRAQVQHVSSRSTGARAGAGEGVEHVVQSVRLLLDGAEVVQDLADLVPLSRSVVTRGL